MKLLLLSGFRTCESFMQSASIRSLDEFINSSQCGKNTEQNCINISLTL